jgi:hypothetical protein
MLHSYNRLYSEKINKNDRKNRAEIHVYEKVCSMKIPIEKPLVENVNLVFTFSYFCQHRMKNRRQNSGASLEENLPKFRYKILTVQA